MVCGIDIGGTKIELAIYNDSLVCLESWRNATPVDDYEKFLVTVINMVRCAETCGYQPHDVGIALPGLLDTEGRMVSVHVPCINGKCVVEDLEEELKRSVAHDNDTRAFTLSELRGGALADASVAMGMILGTGLGGTLAINGELYPRQRGIAGEFGHMPIPKALIDEYGLPVYDCACGSSGCAEQYLSGSGLLRIVSRVGGSYDSAEEVLVAAHKGMTSAQRGLDVYIELLSCFVSRLTLLLDPDVVVFGGGLSNIREIYAHVPIRTRTYLFDGVRPPKIASPVFGATGGTRGAAIMALDKSREL